jgi:transcriptional repressor BetI
MANRTKKQKTRIEDIRRVELIDAAHRIFLRDGLKGLTTTRICHEAGMSQGILTYYFRDKEEVLFEMVRMNHRILMEEVVIHLKRAETRWDRLNAIIDGNFPERRFDLPTARAWISLFAEASHNANYARLLRPYYPRLRSNLGVALRPFVDRERANRFIRGFAAMIDGLWLRKGDPDSDISVAEARQLLQDYSIRMLEPDVIAAMKKTPA